jgi:small subunit ribosomal protein S20
MPIIKSAVKRMHQNRRRRVRRVPHLSATRTMIRKLKDLVKEEKKDEAAKLFPSVTKAIDLAVKKHMIHKKTASRKKSQLASLVSSA